MKLTIFSSTYRSHSFENILLENPFTTESEGNLFNNIHFFILFVAPPCFPRNKSKKKKSEIC